MKRWITPFLALCLLIAFAILPLTPFCLAAEEGRGQGEMTDRTVTQEDETGTDPRGFAPKFMPYYRYTELENNLVVQEMTLFGMFAFNPRFAMTYEWPIAKYLDATDVSGFDSLEGSPGDPGTGPPTSGFQPGTVDGDGDEIGMGDLNLRFFFKPEALEWGYDNSKLTGSIMFGSEILFPTATEEVLGNESLILSPMLVFVHDTPTHGFVALMNFYDFTAFKDRRRDKTKQFRGRWFIMQPLSPPGPGIFSGIYLLPEFQPVYNFEGDNSFSFWFGPEVGKIIGEGKILYAKPGWGVSPTSTEREFTFEFGWRWFF